MPRALDFNEVQSSFLDITLRDDARTVVHMDLPNEGLIAELQGMQGELQQMKTGNQSAVNDIYDLGARLISCNFDLFQVTGEELRTKYGMNLVLMLTFFAAYMGAINELNNQKN